MIYFSLMNHLAEQLNETLGPAAAFLSPAGRRIYFPYGGILGQGAEARGCAINATIGMAFEEDGTPLVMDCFAGQTKLPRTAFLYASSFGLQPLRALWRDLQLQKNPSLKNKRYSLPVITNALTHGLRIVAEMFSSDGDDVLVPDLYWDNYALIFEEACGARLTTFNTFKNGAFDAAAMKKALLAPGDKKILILNFPNNPTGTRPRLMTPKRSSRPSKPPRPRGKRSWSFWTTPISVWSTNRACTKNRSSPNSAICTRMCSR